MSLFQGRGKLKTDTTAARPIIPDGWRFSLKGSPRHYDDVVQIIHQGGGNVYFGEALAYERGAGIALWRVSAMSFEWLPRLYAWWAEQERLEPIEFTFHLYLPNDLKYPALDLREHSPAAVEAFIKERAPRGSVGMAEGAPATPNRK